MQDVQFVELPLQAKHGSVQATHTLSVFPCVSVALQAITHCEREVDQNEVGQSVHV